MAGRLRSACHSWATLFLLCNCLARICSCCLRAQTSWPSWAAAFSIATCRQKFSQVLLLLMNPLPQKIPKVVQFCVEEIPSGKALLIFILYHSARLWGSFLYPIMLNLAVRFPAGCHYALYPTHFKTTNSFSVTRFLITALCLFNKIKGSSDANSCHVHTQCRDDAHGSASPVLPARMELFRASHATVNVFKYFLAFLEWLLSGMVRAT